MNSILKIFDPISKTWKGVSAIKGETGKSAYQLAAEGGYLGTEEQFKEEQVGLANFSGRLIDVEQSKANLMNGYVPSYEIDPLQGKHTGAMCLFGHYAGDNKKLAATEDCSIELIFNMVKLPGRVRCLASIGDIQVSIATNSTLTVVVGNSTIDNMAIPTGLNHVVIALGYEDNSAIVYVNGVLSKTLVFNNTTPSASISIGNNSTGSALYEGTIHSVRIFNYMMPKSTVLELYSQRNTFCSGLSLFEKCDDSMEYILNPEAKYIWDGTSASYYHSIYLHKALPSGYTYRIKYKISNYIVGKPAMLLGFSSDWNVSIPLQSKNGEFSVDVKSRLNFSTSNVLIYGGTIGTDRQFTAEIISIKKLGCIAEYSSLGAQRTKWINTVDRNDLLAVKAPELTYQYPEYATADKGLKALFVARGAVWNASTGFYELNGLTDITEAEMIRIYQRQDSLNSNNWVEKMKQWTERTNFGTSIVYLGGGTGGVNLYGAFTSSNAVIILLHSNSIITTNNMRNSFLNNIKLKKIIGTINIISNIDVTNAFGNCIALEDIQINTYTSISFVDSPLLTRESVLYLINNATNTTPITVTLHTEAKARLTEADIALASSKNITIA